MKKTLTAIAFALPLLAVSSVTLADYQIRIGMETPQGGSLPKGSISFGNGGSVTPPVEPTEPEVVDPFEPEDKRCDPWAVGYPGNSTGKDLAFGSWYNNKAIGLEYRSCKLKPVSKPKLLARYSSIIPSYHDGCNPNDLKIYNMLVKPACSSLGAGVLEFFYQVTGNSPSSFSYTHYNVRVNLDSRWAFTTNDIERIVFDGAVCNNLHFFKHPVWGAVTTMVVCDADITYSQLAAKMDKQFMVEIYGK